MPERPPPGVLDLQNPPDALDITIRAAERDDERSARLEAERLEQTVASTVEGREETPGATGNSLASLASATGFLADGTGYYSLFKGSTPTWRAYLPLLSDMADIATLPDLAGVMTFSRRYTTSRMNISPVRTPWRTFVTLRSILLSM